MRRWREQLEAWARAWRALPDRRLQATVLLVPLAAYVAVYFVDGTGFHPSGDGYYSWIFARSIAFDGDVELTNDYALCGDAFRVGLDRGGGHPDNPFYVGPAAFLVPPLFVLRLLFTVALGAARAAAASCAGWLPALTILAGTTCGALSSWLAYRSARLFVPAPVAAFTALVFAFSSPLFPYSTSVAHYSHVYLTFTVAALGWVSLRAVVEGPRPRDPLWIGVAVAVAILHRLPSLAWAALPAATVLAHLARGDRRRALAVAVAIAAGCAAGVGGTCLLYRYLYARWFAVPQGPDYVHLGHANPFLVLFGVRGGFFFWMPAAWLAVAGLAVALRRPGLRLFTAGWLAAAAVDVLVSSAPLDWHGNWSLGARRLLALTPFVAVLASLVVARVAARLALRPASARAIAAAIVAVLLVNNVPASTTLRGDRELTQRELYGALSPLRPVWGALNRTGFDVALVPAQLWVRARYGLPPSSYRAAITPRYHREYRSLEVSDDELDLRRPELAPLVTRATCDADGMHVARAGRLAFAAEWPFATHLHLRVSAPRPATLRVHAGRLLGARGIGAASVDGGGEPRWIELPMPPGTFGSGLNDLLFEATDEVTVERLRLEDRTPRSPWG